MPAPGELTYYERIGPEGREHVLNKPFSDESRGARLMEVGAVLLLLPQPPGRVLECGCGAGWLSYMLAKSGYDVVGQDVSVKAIELARNNPMFHAQEKPPVFVSSDFEELAFESEFDAAVFFDSLHHSINMPLAIRQVFRALKPGGLMIASEPGVGHAHAMSEFSRTWDVTDKDAPPKLILKLGREAGFSAGQVYPHAEWLGPRLYDRRPGLWGRLKRVVGSGLHIVGTHRGGITLMVK
jgi:SAM-dependent methyltransferase